MRNFLYWRSNWKPPRRPKVPSVCLEELDASLEQLEQLDQLEKQKRGSLAAGVQAYADLLRQCGNARSLSHGKRVHSHLVANGHVHNVLLGELLLQMYAKCGSVEAARALFEAMPQRRVFCWNIMIGAYARGKRAREALDLYKRMGSEDVLPNDATFASALRACASLGALTEGQKIHERIAKGSRAGVDVQTALISMYAKCRRIDLAKSVFEGIQERDVVARNAMIAAYGQNGQGRKALDLYHEMDWEDVQPDASTFTSVVSACSTIGALQEGKAIHEHILSSEFHSDVVVQNALVSMYAKCNRLEDAREVFEQMPERDVVSWTSIIAAYAQHGHSRAALDLYERMDSEGMQPDEKTFASAVTACANLGALEEGKLVHARTVACGLECDGILQNALINMYAKCSSLQEARRVFDKMKQRNVVSWTAMVAAYAQNGHPREGLDLYRQMMCSQGVQPNEITFASALGACSILGDLAAGREIHTQMIKTGFHSNIFAQNSVIDMYAKCGDLSAARQVFEKMLHRDVISWTTIIAAYAQFGHNREALDLYGRMASAGMQPDVITFATAVGACSSLGNLAEGKAIHSRILKAGLQTDALLQNALIHMYAKCGSLNTARRAFEEIQQKTVVTWTSMIAAYAQQGHGRDALELYRLMQSEGVQPNDITFVPVLIACSQAGLLSEGRGCFMSISSDFGVTPIAEHYGCMIDLLGRAGRLDEAEELINSMPFQPDGVAWQTLLSACKLHSNEQCGRRAAEQAWELDPESTSPYVLLSHIYSAKGKKVDMHNIRKQITYDKGLKKLAGYSFI